MGCREEGDVSRTFNELHINCTNQIREWLISTWGETSNEKRPNMEEILATKRNKVQMK